MNNIKQRTAEQRADRLLDKMRRDAAGTNSINITISRPAFLWILSCYDGNADRILPVYLALCLIAAENKSEYINVDTGVIGYVCGWKSKRAVVKALNTLQFAGLIKVVKDTKGLAQTFLLTDVCNRKRTGPPPRKQTVA
jgi:hypothetical protein